jgi:hypothetical protein
MAERKFMKFSMDFMPQVTATAFILMSSDTQ